MTLDRFMDMAKADRYTEEGRQAVNDARRYKVGEISEKTGLQKQNDGSWAPPKTGTGIPKEKAAWNDAAEKAEKLATKPAGKAVQSFIDAIKSGAIGYDPVTTSYIDAEHAKNFNTKLKSHLKASGEDFNSSVKPVVYSPSYKESLLKNGFDAPAELKQENKSDAEAAVSALRKEGLDAVAVKRSDSLIDNSYAVYIRPGSKPAGKTSKDAAPLTGDTRIRVRK